MAIKASGQLWMSEINAEFGRGNNLNSYRGTQWYTDAGGSGTFSSGAISFSEFYSKRLTMPFNATWSGSSISSYGVGLSTSGSSYRHVPSGNWCSLGTNGIFSGNSTYSGTGFVVSNNLIRIQFQYSNASTWVTFTLASKAFSGSSTVSSYDSDSVSTVIYKIETSSNLVRVGYVPLGKVNITYGSYISVS